MERTIDLNAIKNGHPYTWGEVTQVHEVGPYAIVEFVEWKRKGSQVMTGRVGERTVFSTYLNGECLSMSFDTLDHALAHCIAARHQNGGFNSQAALYFMRMIGAA